MKKEIKVPDIAENVEKGTIAAVLVSKGDKVSVDQPLVEIETDKASTDIPSPYDGEVDEVKVKEGDEVSVGQVLMVIETEEERESEPEGAQEKEKEEKKEETQEDQEESKEEGSEKVEKAEDKEEQTQQQRKQSDVPAAPSVRRLAREKGIDLTRIKGSGPGNRIVADDVEKHAQQTGEDRPKKSEQAEKEDKAPEFSGSGPVTREEIKTIRRLTAESVTQSWQSIPHVTHFDEADMTSLENFRKQYQQSIEKEGVKVTVTAILLKIAGFALQKFPRFNASFAENEIVYKHYFNIGVAVDTPQGLLVPVIRDVNTKSLKQLSAELDNLAQKARDRKISSDEMQDGNFTISNLGGIGGTGFTPIILPPQVAILGVSRAVFKPVYREDTLQKRMILPLSVSYDHRIIDGADGARFLRWVCHVIEDPFSILL